MNPVRSNRSHQDDSRRGQRDPHGRTPRRGAVGLSQVPTMGSIAGAIVLLTVIVTASTLAVALGCGGGESGGAGHHDLVLEDYREFTSIDVAAILEAPVIPPELLTFADGSSLLYSGGDTSKPDEWKEEWREAFNKQGLGTLDDISYALDVTVPAGDPRYDIDDYAIIAGKLDFGAIRQILSEAGIRSSTEKGFESWTPPGNSVTSLAFSEDRGLMVTGTVGRYGTLGRVIDAVAEENGFASADDGFSEAIRRAGGGLATTGSRSCGSRYIFTSGEGCELHVAVIKGDDGENTEFFGVMVFGGEKLAKDAMDSFRPSSLQNLEIEKVEVRGRILSYEFSLPRSGR